jgi:hypothetical protein
VVYGVVATIVATTATLTAVDEAASSELKIALAVVAIAGWCFVVFSRARVEVSLSLVLIGAAVMLAVAVAVPPRQSHDLWTYAMYGRIVTEHGSSPYRDTPAEFPHDPALARVSDGWAHTPSPYGPVFTGISAGIVAVTGTNALATRLAFQGLAALAIALTGLVLLTRKVSPSALAFLLLNPVIFVEVVNGGHNDALVGLFVLLGVVLATSRRTTVAALCLAVAASIKIVLLLALGALLVWVWRQYGVRRVVTAAAASGALFLAGYALAGGRQVLEPLRDAREQMSRTSPWQLVRPSQLVHFLALGPRAADDSRMVVTSVAPFVVVLLAIVLVAAASRCTVPTYAVAAGILAYLLLAAYVLPWYVAWVVPLVALDHRTLLAKIVAAECALLLIAWQYRGPAPDFDTSRVVLWWLSALVVGLFAVVATAVVLYRSVRELRRPAHTAIA